MSWADAFRGALKYILIGVGFAMLGNSFFELDDGYNNSSSGFSSFIGAIFILVGYLWMFLAGAALFIKILSDVTTDVVSENFFRTRELMRELIQDSHRTSDEQPASRPRPSLEQ